MTCAASFDDPTPHPPCSQRTATTISGLRRGATPTNHEFARELTSLDTDLAPKLWFTTCAVPVLPAKSMPSRCEERAVPPAPETTAAMPSVMVPAVAGLIGKSASPDPGYESMMACR